jgi:PadR family transcriptional regulator, regulatory protein PadR
MNLSSTYRRTRAASVRTLEGTLALFILKSLALEELHGMGISRRIAQITNGAFEVKASSLFPALHWMEESGWLTSFWGESETNGRAKFCRLTKTGRRQLQSGSVKMGTDFHRQGQCLTCNLGGQD